MPDCLRRQNGPQRKIIIAVSGRNRPPPCSRWRPSPCFRITRAGPATCSALKVSRVSPGTWFRDSEARCRPRWWSQADSHGRTRYVHATLNVEKEVRIANSRPSSTSLERVIDLTVPSPPCQRCGARADHSGADARPSRKPNCDVKTSGARRCIIASASPRR